jgi:hypothetical protein
MDNDYHNIFNIISKLEQQSKEQENKLNEIKSYYENKIKEYEIQTFNQILVQTLEQTYILEPTNKAIINQTGVFNYDNYNDDLNYIFRQNENLSFQCYDKDNVNNTMGRFITEPLRLTIKNSTVHIYGHIYGGNDYIIPFNTNSKKPRLLYSILQPYHNHRDKRYNVILWDNILRLYESGKPHRFTSIYDRNNSIHLTINIHFDL